MPQPSYYVGIGQTLAYLSFGFPQVALWLCFDGDSMTDKEIYEYNDAFAKIIFPLKPFVATTFFKINQNSEALSIQERLWENDRFWWENAIGVPSVGGKNLIRWNSSNLFVSGFQTEKGFMEFSEAISHRAKTVYKFLESQKDIWQRY